MDSRAPGAMPETWPSGAPATLASACMPAAVLEVCEPWPLRSRGEWYSWNDRSSTVPAEYQRAPITLLLHSTGLSSPVTHVPCHLAAMASASGRGSGSAAKLGLSGQKPVSMTPTMTPSPASGWLPNWVCHTPPAPDRPRNRGVLLVWTVTMSFLKMLATPAVPRSFATSDGVSRAAKPLNVTP